MTFNEMLMGMKPQTPKRIAVAAAQDPDSLKALSEGYNMGFCQPILCGNADLIRKNADEQRVDISKFEIVNVPDIVESGRTAVSMIRSGDADFLMKGLIKTADFCRAVLDEKNGIRGSGFLSHVSIMYSPARTYFVTDPAMIPFPDINKKVAMIKSAVDVAKIFGIEHPKVAVLAPIEYENSKIQSTVDAIELTRMSANGEFPGCTVYGPLAWDCIASERAAKKKEITSPVAGRADVVLCHNLDVANPVVKVLENPGGHVFGGILMGADAPILLNSRSDEETAKLYSIACACKVHSAKQNILKNK